jgi:hypothetical protein
MTDLHRDSGMAPRVRAMETLLEQRGIVGGAELDAILTGCRRGCRGMRRTGPKSGRRRW